MIGGFVKKIKNVSADVTVIAVVVVILSVNAIARPDIGPGLEGGMRGRVSTGHGVPEH